MATLFGGFSPHRFQVFGIFLKVNIFKNTLNYFSMFAIGGNLYVNTILWISIFTDNVIVDELSHSY